MPDGSYVHPQERQFNPYTENGGTILAIAGADFSVIAGDTRQSEGYSIQTRYAPKVFRLYVQPSRAFSLRSPLTYRQNRSCCVGGKWVRSRRQHVRKEGEAAARGSYLSSTPRSRAHQPISGTGTRMQKTCPSAPSLV